MNGSVPGRLLVVGASGLVGGELIRAAQAQDLTVMGAARTTREHATLKMDLQDLLSIQIALDAVQPDSIALCSAWPHVDGCEQDPARSERENVQTVRNLLTVLGSSSKVRLLFFSSDHVFDGLKPDAYVESDPVHPLSVYAKHKRKVEELLLHRGHALIARTAWVFGRESRRKNFVYRVIDASRSRSPLRVPRGQAGCPTWSRWLAESSLSLWSGGMDGVVHLTGGVPYTKAEWARTVADALALPDVVINEQDWVEAGQVAPRPERVVLRSERHQLTHPPLKDVLQAELKGE